MTEFRHHVAARGNRPMGEARRRHLYGPLVPMEYPKPPSLIKRIVVALTGRTLP